MVHKIAERAVVCALLLLLSKPQDLQANETEWLLRLMGRWSGQGTVTPASGPSEPFRCVITYVSGEGTAHVRQNLRCQGSNYRFDAATQLHINGSQLTGVWSDNIYALAGTVSGKVTDTGFELRLNGRFFQAKMTVMGAGCEQSVKVVPDRAYYVKELAAELKKC